MPQQKSLFDFAAPPPPPKPVEEKKAQAPTQAAVVEAQAKHVKKKHVYPPVAPENLPPAYFVSASYDGRQKKAIVKLYEPKSGQIYFWYDNTGHKPYCLTNLSPAELNMMERVVGHEGYDHCELVDVFDPSLTEKSQ